MKRRAVPLLLATPAIAQPRAPRLVLDWVP